MGKLTGPSRLEDDDEFVAEMAWTAFRLGREVTLTKTGLARQFGGSPRWHEIRMSKLVREGRFKARIGANRVVYTGPCKWENS